MLIVAILSFLSICTTLQVHAEQDVVGPGVWEALETQETVRVMIVFGMPTESLSASSAQATIKAQCDDILQIFRPGEFELLRRFEAINAMSGKITADGLRKLLDHPAVMRVDLDEGGTGSLAQAVPLANIDAIQSLGLSGSGVTVAVLDSGYDSDHPDLSDDLVGEACFCSGGGGCCPDGSSNQTGAGSAEDDHGHGTNVSGVVTSAGTIAPVGGAPNADVVAVKVLDSSNSFCCTSDVVAGLNWIINNRSDVDIINMSLGTNALFTGDCDNATAFTMAFATAINTLRANGVPVFVSSGNDGSGTQMQAPACVANSIAVGAVWDSDVGAQTVLGCTDATTAADQVTCFSNSSTTTDLFAPGAPTTSTGFTGGTSTFFGTSQASPLAAACAALMLESDPTLTPNDIETALEASPTLVSDVTNGLSFPRLDCLAALGLGNQPPVCNANGPYVAECAGSATSVTLDATASSDPDGDPLTYVWTGPFSGGTANGPTPTVSFESTGLFTVDVEASDGLDTSMCSASVTIEDTTPPELDLLVSPDVIWAPNHKLVTIQATITFDDVCDAAPTVRLVSIASNEPDNGLGDGDKPDDIQGADFGTDDREFQLRA
jgi:subtilisin family serine protease